MPKTALTFNVRLDGARETLQALNRMPKDASEELRKRSLELADALAAKVAAAARAEGRQASLLAPTVKAAKDRVPVVQAGGAKKVGRNKVPAYSVLFGAEFGMNRRTGWYAASRYVRANSKGRQYKPHRGRKGYWFFPTVERAESEIADAWRKAADDVVARFGGV